MTTRGTPEAALAAALGLYVRLPAMFDGYIDLAAAILAALPLGWALVREDTATFTHWVELEAEIERLRAALAEDESMGTEIARLRAALDAVRLAEIPGGWDGWKVVALMKDIAMTALAPQGAIVHRCNCPESGTSGSCPFHDNSTIAPQGVGDGR